MPTSPLSVVIQHLLADVAPDAGGMTDGELLAHFLSSRDDNALVSCRNCRGCKVTGIGLGGHPRG